MYIEVLATLLSTAFWTSCYYAIQNRWLLEAEWSCRLLTAIHAVTVTFLAGLSCYFGPNPFTDPGGPNTFLQDLTLSISLGYFLFDMTWCLYYQTEGKTMLIHHGVSLISIGRVLMKGYSGTEAVAGIFGLEITNPLLQARWFLRSAGYKNTVLYTIVELIFMTMFFVFRIIWGSFLVFTTVMHPRPDLEAKLEASSFYALSWVFMIFITQYFIAKYIRKPQKKPAEKSS